MPDGWTLRSATPEDAAGIARVHVQAWREAHAGIVPQTTLDKLSVERRAELWREWIAEPSRVQLSTIRVGLVDGTIIGFGFGSAGPQRSPELRELGQRGELQTLYLVAAAQRRGLGRALLEALRGDLAAIGHDPVGFWVFRDNAPARRFYERLGARVLVESQPFELDGHTLIEVGYGWPALTPPA